MYAFHDYARHLENERERLDAVHYKVKKGNFLPCFVFTTSSSPISYPLGVYSFCSNTPCENKKKTSISKGSLFFPSGEAVQVLPRNSFNFFLLRGWRAQIINTGGPRRDRKPLRTLEERRAATSSWIKGAVLQVR